MNSQQSSTMGTSKLYILYWNARSIRLRKEDILRISHKVDIIACVESWLNSPDINFEIPGFLCYRKDRTHTIGGGIIILIRKDIAFKEITNIQTPDPTIELAGIEITNVSPTFSLFTLYRTPMKTLSLDQWESVFSNLTKYNNYILVGDFNAHNCAWNCNKTDTNGANLLKCVINHNTFIHNSNTYTHIDNTSKSNIDLVFSSCNIADKINLKINEDTWGSDHYPIFINLDSEKSYYRKKSFKLHSKKTNWLNVSAHLESAHSRFFTHQYECSPASQKYDLFISILSEAIASSTPTKKNVSPNMHRNPVSWWDEECNDLKEKRKRALSKWKDSLDLQDLIDYKRMIALCRNTFKMKRKEKFKDFTNTVNFSTDSRYVWNTLKILKNKWTKVSSSHATENLQINNQITAIDKICPPWVPTNPDTLPYCKSNPFLESEFTLSEFNLVINSKKTHSSPGLDGIDYAIIKNLPLQYKLLLLDIFNEMYRTSDFPTNWNHSYIHLILKSDGKNFRPIALTSAFCKIFESLLKNKLEWWFEKNDILPVSQSGFRRGQSCTDNLTNVTLHILQTFKKKKPTYGIFLDICAAFDNVNIDLLLQKLAIVGCPTKFIKFVKFLTYKRIVHCGFDTNIRHSFKGVPQGGVLSPLLYIFYVSEILNKVSSRILISQFADDIAVFSSNLNSLQKATQTIETNLVHVGLDLAPQKSVLINFNNLNILPGETEITIGNHTIKSSESTRFLGVIFDYKLTFNGHVNKLHSKCLKSLNILKYLQGIWWGADPSTLLTAYISFIRSIIDYACFIYFPTRKNITNKLEQIQFAAIRLALGFRKTTPTNILLAESKLPLISERTKFLCYSYLSKVLSTENLSSHKAIVKYINNNKKLIKKRRRLLENCILDFQKLIPQIYKTPKFNIFLHDYSILTTSIPFDKESGIAIKKSTRPNTTFKNIYGNSNSINIFTDGSKSQKSLSVGTACINENKNNQTITRSLQKEFSIFSAECIALSDAFSIALNYTNRANIIFSDSLSVLECLSNPKINVKINPVILEIKEKFFTFNNLKTDGGSVRLVWVPAAHTDIKNNDNADLLAKNASLSTPSDAHNICFTDLRERFKTDMYTNTVKYLEETSAKKGSVYFQNFYCKTRKPWFFNKKLPRELIVTINRCRSNHYNLPASLYRVNIVDDPKCECGHEQKDLDHILWECTLYALPRRKLLTELWKLKIYLPIKIAVILEKPAISACKQILFFLKSCNIKI